MRNQIIGIGNWLKTPIGISLLEWESSHLDTALVNCFGYHALQLGLPELDGLRTNRMPHRWCVPTHLECDFRALPFPADCIDLVVLPHVLEFSPDPYHVLREVERIVIHEGRVVIFGFNPFSLKYPNLPQVRKFIPYWRLKNELNRLGLEVESIHWQSLLGMAYCMVAVKHTRGMHLIKSPWKNISIPTTSALPAANRTRKYRRRPH
ncbi:MAG: hypothetical protein RIR79_1109 [Pseudomonadota bacterium]|jgi:SAM-dependent methyltransferase